MNNRASLEVNVIKPHTFEDSQEICNMLLTNRPVIVNLEGFDPDDAQRIMDIWMHLCHKRKISPDFQIYLYIFTRKCRYQRGFTEY